MNRQNLNQRRKLARLEKKAAAAQQRYDTAPRGRKLLALFRLRDAVTKALAAS